MTLEIAKDSVDIRMNNDNFCESFDVKGTSETKINVAGKFQLILVGLDDNRQFTDRSVSNNIQLPFKIICALLVFSKKIQSPWETHHHLPNVLSDES
jgi:hypothetical protein